MTDKNIYDLLIIGGGINGAGIAHYASHHGFKVYLSEKYDFGSQTSSSSTKLLHGGLRYLENYEFGLVKSALQERNKLYDIASHIVRPLDFVLINNPLIRNKWLIRTGLFIYDSLAGFCAKFKKTKTLNLCKHIFGSSLDLEKIIKRYRSKTLTAFTYSDLWVDDARLTILNIMAARYNDASINRNTELLSAHYDISEQLWHANFINHKNGSLSQMKAKIIINATGPWVNKTISNNLNLSPSHDIRLVKGSHIIVPKLYLGEQCYVLQHEDKRLVFVIPYLDKYNLIGTTETDEEQSALLNKPTIDNDEINYLLAISNDFFKTQLSSKDIIGSYSGIRPLLDSGEKNSSNNTRDYLIEIYKKNNFRGPLINIYGGKITTYRVLALKVIKKLLTNYKSLLPTVNFNINYDEILLPGANLNFINHDNTDGNIIDAEKYAQLKNKYPPHIINYIVFLLKKYNWLDIELAIRFTVNYGNLTEVILVDCKSKADLGISFGATLYSREVDYLLHNEFAETVDDIIWRRTKLGFDLQDEDIIKLRQYIEEIV